MNKYMEGYFDNRTLAHIDAVYAWKHGLYFPPVFLEVDPTTRCMQNCIFCYVNKRDMPNTSLTDEKLIDIFRQAGEIGVHTILIQGAGEPLLHRALPEAIDMGWKYKLPMGLVTNGVMLNRPMQEKILAKLAFARFSVLDFDRKRYAAVHGCNEKQCDMVIDNIKTAIEYREKNKLMTPIWGTIYPNEYTIDHIYDICKYFKDMGIDYLAVNEASYNAFGTSGKKSYYSALVSKEKNKYIRDQIMSLCDDNFKVTMRFPIHDDSFCHGRTKETYIKGQCQGIKFQPTITAAGEVIPCWRAWGNNELSYGNIYEHTLDEIWHSERRQKIEKYILDTPPEGDECTICNPSKTNTQLEKTTKENRWRGFLM